MSPSNPGALSDALKFHVYLLEAGRAFEGALEVGPFVALFEASDDNPYRNYAVPFVGAEPTRGDVLALIEAFVLRKRRPRLEYVAHACPAVRPVLEASGFRAEASTPLMAPLAEPTFAPAAGFVIELARSAADLLGVAETQSEAFAAPLAGEADILRLRKTIEDGGLIALARFADGRVASAGQSAPLKNGVTEIAGVATRAEFRRLGLAAAVTSMLAAEAAEARAALICLMAGHEGSRRVYERAGFRTVGEILHISRPG